MALPTRLQTNNLPSVSEDMAASTASPARGRETRLNLLQKLRPPALVHSWEFWHEKPGSAAPPIAVHADTLNASTYAPSPSTPLPADFAPQLSNLLTVTDVRTFWSLFNNFDFADLPQKTSVHLFHSTVKPMWEDPRNVRGGSWTFRVPKQHAVDFWKEICLLAIGEQLQEAVASDRTTFRDDICGVSFRPRYASTLITIWNRDCEHKEGIDRIFDTVMNTMPEELQPKEGASYYKKHSEHDGFNPNAPAPYTITKPDVTTFGHARNKSDLVTQQVSQVGKEVDKLKQMLDSVKMNDQDTQKKLTSEIEKTEAEATTTAT